VGIADDPGDAGKGGELFGSALGIATSDDDADGGIGGVKLTNCIAGLGVSGRRDGAGVDDHDVCGSGSGGTGATAVEQLALKGGTIGLRGAAAELFDEEGGHLKPGVTACISRHRARPDPDGGKRRAQRRADSILYSARTRETTQSAAAPYKDSGFGEGRKDRSQPGPDGSRDLPLLSEGCAVTIFRHHGPSTI